MNRNQRRLGRTHQKRCDGKLDREHGGHAELEEVLPPRSMRYMPRIDKFTTNKCCYVAPTGVDVGQITEENVNDVTYQSLRKEQYGFDQFMPDAINKLKELKKLLCYNIPKVDVSSQFSTHKKQSVLGCAETIYDSQWQNVDNAEDIDKYLGQGKAANPGLYLPENVHISETPRIKIIAKKFSRLKENNIELRKLDEKVVCVEYDVYLGNDVKPREVLRAFFSIKPTYGTEENDKDDDIPTKDKHSSIKNKFKIASDDLEKLNEKEIEIIDGKIQENKTYLEDLKRILRRKQTIYNKRNKNSLDLMSLYEMAKKESPPLDDGFSNTNFLSKAELQEMKDLIIRKCASSVHGINRRTVKDTELNNQYMGVISQSIVAELWREGNTAVN